MAVTLYSNTGTEADLEQAMVANGVEPEAKVAEVKEVPAKVASEQKVEPGEKTAAETPAKTEPDTEPENKSTQQGATQEQTEKKKAKGGFQRRVEILTAETDRIKDELNQERGDKAKLRKELAEANRRLEAINNPPVDEKVSGPVRPKRPEMPDREELGYDEDKFVAAMKQYRTDMAGYDEKLDKYTDAMAERKVQEALTKQAETESVRKQKEKSDTAYAEFIARNKKGQEAIPDFDEVKAMVPDEVSSIFDSLPDGTASPAYAFAVMKAKHPAELFYHFLKDAAENDSAENEKYAQLDPIDLVIELRALESRLAIQREKGTASTTEQVAKEPEPKTPPVAQPKPKIAKAPDAPLEPVGSAGTTVPTGDLNALMAAAAAGKNYREFNRLLDIQQTRNRQARA